jgi:hypothetical protein
MAQVVERPPSRAVRILSATKIIKADNHCLTYGFTVIIK